MARRRGQSDAFNLPIDTVGEGLEMTLTEETKYDAVCNVHQVDNLTKLKRTT